MKKLSSLLLIAGTCAFISCGPSKEEQDAAQQKLQDSIAQVEAAQKATEDSLEMVHRAQQDSLAAAQKAAQDSMSAKMEQMEKKMNAKPKPKSTEEKKKEEAKKATQGRG